MRFTGFFQCTSDDEATVLEVGVRRWFRTSTEVWVRSNKGSWCEHTVFSDLQHKPWFRRDGTKASCRLSLRLDRVAFAMMHHPHRALPDNVVTLHQRGHYR
jgi:hypothetical protein